MNATPNAVADYVFEKALAEHDASKAKDTVISNQERELAYLKSRLDSEVRFSNSVERAHQAAKADVLRLQTLLDKAQKERDDYKKEALGLAAAGEQLALKFISLQGNSKTLAQSYMRLYKDYLLLADKGNKLALSVIVSELDKQFSKY